MKILIIPSWYPDAGSNSGSFFADKARLLVKYGCEVCVASTELRVRMRGKKHGIFFDDNAGVAEYRYYGRNFTPFSESGIAFQRISAVRRVYERILKEHGRPDIIHLESARCARAAVSLAKSESIPLTYTEHYSGIFNSKQGSYFDRTMRYAVNNAAHIFVISSAMRDKLSPPEGKWSMQPNQIDFSTFTLATRPKTFTFRVLGSLRKIKGYDLLLRAFAICNNKYPQCRLIIGGSGVEEKSLKALCFELGLDNSVDFVGEVSENCKNDFYNNTSAFVVSSHTETFSVVTLEALACGIPVLATKCGGPQDLINDDNGILVEKDNIDALAEGMIRMIAQSDTFNPTVIRDNARSLYDVDILIKRQIECFQSVLNQANEGR